MRKTSLIVVLCSLLFTSTVYADWPNPQKNILINGNMNIAQRGTYLTNVSNGSYTLDRWKYLSAGTATVYRESSDVPVGASHHISINAPASLNGIVQIIEQDNSAPLNYNTVSLSFQARSVAQAIQTIRAGILCWTGTANAPINPVDPSNWSLASNSWSYMNNSSSLALTSAWQTFKVENVYVNPPPNNKCNNLAVMIWSDTNNSGQWSLGTVQLELGPNATTFRSVSMGTELAEAQRYYQNSYPSDTALGTPVLAGSYDCRSSLCFVNIQKMLKTPTITIYCANGTNLVGKVYEWATGNHLNASIDSANDHGFYFTITGGQAQSVYTRYLFHWAADAEL